VTELRRGLGKGSEGGRPPYTLAPAMLCWLALRESGFDLVGPRGGSQVGVAPGESDGDGSGAEGWSWPSSQMLLSASTASAIGEGGKLYS